MIKQPKISNFSLQVPLLMYPTEHWTCESSKQPNKFDALNTEDNTQKKHRQTFSNQDLKNGFILSYCMEPLKEIELTFSKN